MPIKTYNLKDLIDNAHNGNAQELSKILEENPGLATSIIPGGYTALMVAASHGNTDCVRLLLNKMTQETINARADNGTSAIYNAAIIPKTTGSNNVKCIALLLDKVYDEVINAQNQKEGKTLLMLALIAGRTEAAILIANKMSHDALIAKDNQGCNALIYAAVQGDLEFIKFILPKLSAEEINATSASGSTALEYIIRFEHASCLEALVYYMSVADVRASHNLLLSSDRGIPEDCEQILKKYYDKMDHAPEANIRSINGKYVFYVNYAINATEMARICRDLDIKHVVIHDGVLPDTIKAIPKRVTNITIGAGVTAEAIAAIPGVRWVIIDEGSTPAAVAVLPAHIKRVIIANNASPAAVASLPPNIREVYIGTGNTPEAVAAIPARIITIKLMYKDVEPDVIRALPKTAQHIYVNNQLSPEAAAALHEYVTDVVIQDHLAPEVVEELLNKYKGKPITFWLDKKAKNGEGYEKLISDECKVIEYKPENMQCVPYSRPSV